MFDKLIPAIDKYMVGLDWVHAYRHTPLPNEWRINIQQHSRIVDCAMANMNIDRAASQSYSLNLIWSTQIMKMTTGPYKIPGLKTSIIFK